MVGRGSNKDVVAGQDDMEPVDRQEMLSQAADQDRREDQQVTLGRRHLNSNSNSNGDIM